MIGEQVIAIETSEDHSLAVTATGAVWSWGANPTVVWPSGIDNLEGLLFGDARFSPEQVPGLLTAGSMDP